MESQIAELTAQLLFKAVQALQIQVSPKHFII